MDDDWDPMEDDFKSKSFNSYNRGQGAALLPGGNNSLYIVGIPLTMTEAALKNIFQKYGPVREVLVGRPRDNRNTSFGFVHFQRADDALKAVMDQNEKPTLNMKTVFSVPKEPLYKKRREQEAEKAEYLNKTCPDISEIMKNSPPNKGAERTVSSNGRNSVPPQIQFGGRGRTIIPASNLGHFGSTQEKSSTNNPKEKELFKMNYSSHGSKRFTGNYNDQGMMSQQVYRSDAKKCFNGEAKEQILCCACHEPAGLFRCYRCKSWYCGQDCQICDWPEHKVTCIKVENHLCDFDGKPGNDNIRDASPEQHPQGVGSNHVSSNQASGLSPPSLRTNDVHNKNGFQALKDVKTTPNQHFNIKTQPKITPISAAIVDILSVVQPSASAATYAPQFNLEDGFKVVLTFSKSPTLFWVNNTTRINELNQLQNDLQQEVNDTNQDGNFKPLLESICAAKFYDDQTWYRSKVTSVKSSKLFEVNFVDFGNTQITKIEDLKPLPFSFHHIPPLAYPCSLPIQPVNDEQDWSKEVSDAFMSFTQGITLTVLNSKLNGKLWTIDLKDDEDTNIADSFVLACLADKITAPVVSNSQSAPIAPLKAPTGGICELKKFPPSILNFLKVDSELNLIVTAPTNSPLQFWCMAAVSEYIMHISEMEESFLKTESKVSFLQSSCKSRDVVMAKSADGIWYRASILNISSSSGYHVRYVDYGNSEDVAEVKPLSSQNFELTSCCLHVTFPKNFDIKKYSIVEDMSLSVKVVSVNEERAVVEYFGSDHQFICRLRLMAWNYDLVDTLQLQSPSQMRNNLGTRPPRSTNNRTSLSPIQSNAVRNSPQPKAAQFSPSQSANFKSTQISPNQYKAAQTSPSQFKVPQANPSQSEAAQTVSSQPKFVRSSPHNDQNSLHKTQDHLLPQSSQSTTQQNSPVLKPAIIPKKTPFVEGEVLNVVLAWITSETELYVQMVTDAAVFTQVSNDLNSACLKNPIKPQKSPIPANLVCSLFEDGLWYRAQVVEVLTDQKLLVHFIDYGNTAVVDALHVLEIPNSLLEIPRLSHFVTLELGITLDKDMMSRLLGNRTMKVLNIHSLPKDCLAVVAFVDEEAGKILPTPVPTPKKKSVSFQPDPVPVDVKADYTLETFPSVILPIGENINLVINDVISPEMLWCTFANTEEVNSFMLLSKELEAYCQGLVEKGPNIVSHKTGDIVLAQYSVDKNWYRSAVLTEGPKYGILFLDYGNMESVPAGNVYPIIKKFADMPSLAVQCSLVGILMKETKWSEDIVKEIQELIAGKGSTIPVKVVKKNDENDIYYIEAFWLTDELIKKGLALRDTSYSPEPQEDDKTALEIIEMERKLVELRAKRALSKK